MKKFLTLLVTSTAITAAVGALALTALGVSAGAGERPFAGFFDRAKERLPLILASDDHDDDDRDYRRSSRRHDDDDDDDRKHCDASNPIPTGIVTPSSNGLFGNGAPPKIKVN